MVNKSVFLSLLVIGVVAAAAGAGTWAAFSDVEASTGNTFTAGTLDLKLDEEDGITGFDLGPVAPNTPKTLADSIDVSNAGNVDGALTASVTSIVDSAGAVTDGEFYDGFGNLSSEVTIYVSNGTIEYSALLADVLDGTDGELTDMDFGTLGADQTITVSYSVADAGNEIQGDSVSFDIEFSLDQN